MFLGCLAGHFEAVIVRGEEVGGGHEVVGLGLATALFVEVLPHVILPAETPATGEVVELLVSVHVLENLESSATDVEVDSPFVALLRPLETVELQGVDDAFVL